MERFGMFSDKGNKAVSAMVDSARKSGADEDDVADMIEDLSAKFPEASDTAVREKIAVALSLDSTGILAAMIRNDTMRRPKCCN